MGDSPLEMLLAQRPRFLAFVRGQVSDDSAAEDIVQTAFERATLATSNLRSPDSATAWFYRILRNAIVDHHRRRSASQNALEQLARESTLVDEPVGRRICGCAFTVLPKLRDEYQAIILAVDVDGRAVEEAARQLGITANNASVRLHRGRRALREKLLEFCVDCCCGKTAAGCRDCYCPN